MKKLQIYKWSDILFVLLTPLMYYLNRELYSLFHFTDIRKVMEKTNQILTAQQPVETND